MKGKKIADGRAVMEKDTRLVNIYIKIHNKRSLTIDDLSYLAKYDPECFEKTCKNVVYNIPETKKIMEPVASKTPTDDVKEEPSKRQNIEQVLENLKSLEINEFPITDVNADHVKDLLGNLYMELLFPHNDKDISFYMMYEENKSLFDKKA